MKRVLSIILIGSLLCTTPLTVEAVASETPVPASLAPNESLTDESPHAEAEISDHVDAPTETEAPSLTDVPTETEAPSLTDAPTEAKTPELADTPTEAESPSSATPSTASIINGWQKVNDDFYYYEDGKMFNSGWKFLDGYYRFFQTDGKMYVNGWKKQDGYYRYFNEWGCMLTSCWKKIDGYYRYLNEWGCMITSQWAIIDGYYRYLNEWGCMITNQWMKIDGYYRYLNEWGCMLTNQWIKTDEYYRYVNEWGCMITGWQRIDGFYRFLSPTGCMVTGWQVIDGYTRYFNEWGCMMTGEYHMDNQVYYFNEWGCLIAGIPSSSNTPIYYLPIYSIENMKINHTQADNSQYHLAVDLQSSSPLVTYKWTIFEYASEKVVSTFTYQNNNKLDITLGSGWYRISCTANVSGAFASSTLDYVHGGTYGKRIAVLGDSLSTYMGITSDYYYSANKGLPINDMYWYQYILSHNCRMDNLSAGSGVAINALGGSLVSWNPSTKFTYDECFASDSRINSLAQNGTPDIIFIFGGVNDLCHDIPVGSFNSATAASSVGQVATISEAYNTMLARANAKYPKATIVCITPYYGFGEQTKEYVDQCDSAMISIAKYYGAKVIDLRTCDISSSDLDSLWHLNSSGMNKVYQAIASIA